MRQLGFSFGVAFGLALAVTTTDATGRPGGGQSFRSGSSSSSSGSSSWGSSGSSRSSSGSSWGSSGSSRSSSGSSWGSSGSSRSSTSSGSGLSWGSSGSSYSPSTSSGSYRPSYPSTTTYDRRDIEHANCIGRCSSGPADQYNSCSEKCDSERDAAKARDAAASPPPVEVERKTPLSRFFLIPGIVIGLVAAGGLARHVMRKREEEFWASANQDLDRDLSFRFEQEQAKKRFPDITGALAGLRSSDENFSFTLFEDFLHVLYVEAQTLRGGNRLELLKSYLSDNARAAYAPYRADSVTAIVVGALETISVAVVEMERKVRVEVGFIVNYTETKDGRAESFYSREVWTLARGADIPSRPPKRARTLDCGNCGAPLEKLLGATCAHCGAPASPGSRDWEVEAIRIEERELRGPMLTGTTEEEGTDLPTVVAPNVKAEYGALMARDPAFDWGAFVQRVELVFHTFHAAWSSQKLEPVRPFLSDNLFETQTYWVAAYQGQKLRNVTEGAQILSVQLSRIVHDKFYDAVTVRVFAQCLDYTLDRNDTVVGGSKQNVRRYSEYWTFIRSAARTGPARSDRACPSCGAPIEHIDVAGTCTSCQVKVTNGEFDWILSRIEQDEVYRL